jgi:propanediol dehydratase small subunit
MTTFTISPERLLIQAATAREAGYTQLAENFERAAELTQVPNEVMLRMYECLRPGRSTQAELAETADTLERDYAAHKTAAFVREALAVYIARGLLKP